ncbi:MAG: M48 family metallopeptidase [Bacteroidaceae bacterium]|nr:M48 family metallopeptidase [Bacteroidaceae bacterium]
MAYIGMHMQQARNNTRSLLLLAFFPLIVLGMVWLFFYILATVGNNGYYSTDDLTLMATDQWVQALPWVVGIVGVWFAIAYFFNASMVRRATGARPLERRENPRVYNIVENLCMACGMDMPQINVVDDPQLNAFASGIDKGSYTVTVTTGICQRLNDDELEGVIAHELTHIRNRDTRLLIISIVFVGILSTVCSLAIRMLWNTFIYGGGNRRSNDREGGGNVAIAVVFAIAALLAAIGYLFALLTRFAISRKREFMADAGGAEISGKPWALANALRKISGDPGLQDVEREDIAQLYIVHPQAFGSGFSSWFNGLFSTHPDTAERIRLLEQF